MSFYIINLFFLIYTQAIKSMNLYVFHLLIKIFNAKPSSKINAKKKEFFFFGGGGLGLSLGMGM